MCIGSIPYHGGATSVCPYDVPRGFIQIDDDWDQDGRIGSESDNRGDRRADLNSSRSSHCLIQCSAFVQCIVVPLDLSGESDVDGSNTLRSRWRMCVECPRCDKSSVLEFKYEIGASVGVSGVFKPDETLLLSPHLSIGEGCRIACLFPQWNPSTIQMVGDPGKLFHREPLSIWV